MPQNTNQDCDELRQEILRLLRAQIQALQQLSGLSDVELSACYQRQVRVGELRDQLFVLLNSEAGTASDLPSTPIASPAIASLPQAAVIM